MRDDDTPTREFMARAIRRLSILEYVILGGAALLAILAGAIVAWMLESLIEVPFQISWIVASLLFFLIPGAVAYGRERRSRNARSRQRRSEGRRGRPDGDERSTTTRDADVG